MKQKLSQLHTAVGPKTAATVIAVISMTLAIILNRLPFMRGFENQLVNFRFYLKDHITPDRQVSAGVIQSGTKVQSPVLIIGIDEVSVSDEYLGPWPWDRSIHAGFVNYFNQAKRTGSASEMPAFIFFDIFFDYRRGRSVDDRFLRAIGTRAFDGKICRATSREAFADRFIEIGRVMNHADGEFIRAVRRNGNVILDYMTKVETEERMARGRLLRRLRPVLRDALTPVNPDTYIRTMRDAGKPITIADLKPPLPELARYARGLGSAAIEADADGIVRRIPLIFLYHDERVISEPVFLPTIDLIMAMKLFDVSPDRVIVEFGKSILLKDAHIPIYARTSSGRYKKTGTAVRDVSVPIDRQGRMYINFQGGSGSFEWMPYHYIAMDSTGQNRPFFRNRMLMVGFASTAGLGESRDYHFTPYGLMYGVEVHANAFETILSRRFIRLVPDIWQYMAVTVVVFALTTTLFQINVVPGLIVTILTLLAVFVGQCLIFSSRFLGIEAWGDQLYITNIILSMTAMVSCLTLTIAYRIVASEKDKRFLKETFSQYVSPQLIDIMYRNKTIPEFDGSTTLLTAFFTDIEGFSSFSEQLTAPQLVTLLNEYLGEMSSILLEEHGTLDKYIGDAIVAFFGAPLPMKTHAISACRAAVRMQTRLEDLKKKWRSEKVGKYRNEKGVPADEWPEDSAWPKSVLNMRMRIGINTGEIVTGNIGSATRKNYTMMGDSVNLASRLESAAKQYGLYTLVSGRTFYHEFTDENGDLQRVSDFVDGRMIDRVIVKGRNEAEVIFEVICMKGEMTQLERLCCRAYERGLQEYFNRNWESAIKLFTASSMYEFGGNQRTNPSTIMLQRCRRYLNNPDSAPPEGWDGALKLLSK